MKRIKDEDLDDLLSEWESVPARHPRLNQRVWARIASDEAEDTSLPGFFKLVQSVLGRPLYASVFVVGCVLLGLLLAEVRVANLHAKRNADLAENYQAVIDPLFRATSLNR